MSDLDEIEDLVENSHELTSDQKRPLRWAIKKAREEDEVRGFDPRFDTDDFAEEAL